MTQPSTPAKQCIATTDSLRGFAIFGTLLFDGAVGMDMAAINILGTLAHKKIGV